ncbi:hypothetical protein [Sediminibacterium goheungense]|uniref:Uncharacterized protein n=1 Tax=Sediminibacterium goheungense TaxID=1086393 RepID=A0A4R6ITF3_9BACT|nr:hypothetical protein [Sediminibacterium goheungense]TDO25793.1 hypothetical protein BC659_2716 [Sediminibacterium goheungense]
MSKIEFIPLIELPTIKDKDNGSGPSGTSKTNTFESDLYQQKLLSKSYKRIPAPISKGVYQYCLFDIELDDLEAVIKLHISDTEINQSCSLFGGYAISVDDNIELYPQCCGLLEEIQYWKTILKSDFEDFYLLQCHPSPLISKRGTEIIIQCKDESEAFWPLTIKEIIKLDYLKTRAALVTLIKKLERFSNKLNSLSEKFGVTNISDILIWGKL